MYKYDQKPATVLSDEANKLLEEILTKDYAVLCGRNNCGKSYILKLIREKLGQKASFLGPARYQNFNMLTPYSPQSNRKRDEFRNWLEQWRKSSQNFDNSPFNLQQAIAELSDEKREYLKEIMENLLGAKMEILHTIPNNSMSQQYISVNGYNISFTSSGYRLIASLATSLLDDDYHTFLIDEPELGISPEAQGIFSEFLFDPAMRERYFPHVRTLIMATHSTVFLDRVNIDNNYFVAKSGDVIDIEKTESVSDINRIHFFLLGNRLESLYMPSAIIIVEGKCDHAFIERVLNVKRPDVRFSIISANTDNRIREVFNTTKSLFGDIQKSPYQNRIFAVIDSVHGSGLVQQLEKMGLPKENIIVWTNNGIEFYYPESVIKSIFHSDETPKIEGDQVSVGNLSYNKVELLNMVLPKISKETEFNDEFRLEFLEKIERTIA